MKVQERRQNGIIGRICLLAVVFVLQAVLVGQFSITANAQGTAKVAAASAKIRKTPSTSSDVLASVQKNAEVTVLAQTTAEDGYTWYQILVNGSEKGFIRADLLSKVEGSIDTISAQNSTTANTNASTEGNVDFVQVNDSTAAAGKVTGSTVRVRSNPSTDASVAGSASGGTEVTISGEASDNEGKIWYQVSFTSGNETVNGFIRSDFLEITQTNEAEPETPPVEEAPVEETVTTEKKEYELVFEANREGVEEWFLYDHNRGTKQSLADLLAVVRQTQDNENSAASQLKTLKMIMIAAIGVIIVLIIVITLLIFKLRDSYEYEYEDDEDDEEDDDEEDEEEDEEDDDEEDEAPVVKKSVFRRGSQSPKQPSRVVSTPESEVEATPKSAAKPAKQESSWQSKNFLDIDDDMEFEFLDIK